MPTAESDMAQCAKGHWPRKPRTMKGIMGKEKSMTVKEKALADTALAFAKQCGIADRWTGKENCLFIARRAFEHGLPREKLADFVGELQTLNLGGNARLFGVATGIIKEQAAIAGDDLLVALGIA